MPFWRFSKSRTKEILRHLAHYQVFGSIYAKDVASHPGGFVICEEGDRPGHIIGGGSPSAWTSF